jgi:calcineurin-like phosphoesterase family protein
MRLYISDQHFFDSGVCFNMDKRGFETIEEMNEYMIRQWNSKVKRGDEIFVIGDMFSYKETGIEGINKVLHHLNGKIYLCIGNHDEGWIRKKGVDLARFTWIRQTAVVSDQGREVLLAHYPIPFFGKNHARTKAGDLRTFMLHGHVHASPEADLLYKFQDMAADSYFTNRAGEQESMKINMLNTFCGYSDYKPLSIDEWIEVNKALHR